MRVTDYCVGELSSRDVECLIGLAKGSHRVLEFGAGGSTTLWSQFCPNDRTIVCVETNPEWSKKTADMCVRLGCGGASFLDFKFWRDGISKRPWFDLIFIDSISIPQRIDIAKDAWDLLMPHGHMVWHDTHSSLGADVFRFLADHHLEVGSVRRESALTIATKCVETMIGNTDAFEGRAPWESGHAPLPESWPRKR